MPMIDTDTLERELHAVAVTRRDYLSRQRTLPAVQPGELADTLARIDQAYLRYTEALLALGERVASMVDLDPPAPTLTIVET